MYGTVHAQWRAFLLFFPFRKSWSLFGNMDTMPLNSSYHFSAWDVHAKHDLKMLPCVPAWCFLFVCRVYLSMFSIDITALRKYILNKTDSAATNISIASQPPVTPLLAPHPRRLLPLHPRLPVCPSPLPQFFCSLIYSVMTEYSECNSLP